MPNIKAAESGLLFSSDIELENLNSNNDVNDDAAYRYDEFPLMDTTDFYKQLCPRYRQSAPAFETDCSNVCRYGDGCCQLGDTLDCECDGLESSGSSCSKTMVNVSCRAVARPSDCGLGYQYQIIDIKTYPETGLLCCPPGNNPNPLDLDSFCKKVEEPPECCPSWSSDSFSRNSLPSRLLNSSSSRPSLRRRRSGGSTSYSKSTEHSKSTELSEPSSSRTRSSYTRSSNTTSQSRTTTEPTETQTRSSRSTKSKECLDPCDEETVTANHDELTDDELNENENNVGSVKDNGSSESINNQEIDQEILEDIANDGYSDLEECDVAKDAYSSDNIKSAVLESLQSQLRSKTTRSSSFSKSSKYSSSTTPLNKKSGKSLPKLESSELDEFVLNNVDYHPMLSFPRLKTHPNKRTSSMAATTGSSSTCDRHQAKMMKFLRSLYCQRELTDITIQVGCSCFNAHRIVLSCYSKYFASRLIQKSCCPLKNIIMLENNISAKTFSSILDFMYTGEIQIDRGNLAKIFTAADFLEINSLKVRCERLLSNGFKEGSKSSKSHQLEKQWQQVARNFRVITKTDQFLNLSSDCIQRLLCRDDLTIDSEMDVAKAAVRWLNFDRDKRRKYTRSVMSCIRFKDLWPEELVRLTSTHQSLLADDSIKEAIFEANWYHTCQQRENSCKLSSSLV